MSRASTKGRPAVKIPSGDLAVVSIGIETLIVQRAVAHKLLPLLEKALMAERGYSSIARRDAYVASAACQPEYTAIQASQVRTASAEERDEHSGS